MQKICFNKNWTFANGKAPFTREASKIVDLPHDFMIEQDRDPNSLTRRDSGYFPGGLGWYSKKFFVPDEWHGKSIFVEFEGIYMTSEVKLNGNVIKRQNYGYTTFNAKLNKYIKYNQENELSVLVDNTTVPNSRWYSGSGIYRYAWLYVGDDKGYIDLNGIYVKTDSVSANNDSASVSVILDKFSGTGKNNLRWKNIIVDLSDDSEVASDEKDFSESSQTCITIKNPKLWDVDSPNLYKVVTNIYNGDELTDTAETIFGIRTFSLSADEGFVLNGRGLKLKGGCVHHDNGIIGSASYVRSEERRVELLKQSGFNAVRTAHNPPSPAFLDACDRLGMLVLDEAFDQWRMAKTQYDYHRDFDNDYEHDLSSMILRDRNHPSVVFWSIGNEVPEQTGQSDAPSTSKKLCEIIRKLDDRPITIGLYPPTLDKSKADADFAEQAAGLNSVLEPLDFVGYNYYYDKYAEIHANHPNRIIASTETVPKEIYQSWEAVLKNNYVIGDFVWTAIDYLGEAGIGRVYYTEERPEIEWHLYDYPWNQAYCGDIDVCGFKRPQSYYRDILWGVSDKPKMFVRRPSRYSPESEKVTFWGWHDGIEGWDFDVSDGTQVIVDVYSPAASVELWLNGELIGKNNIEELKTVFNVPYKKGELKAIDSNGNAVILSSSNAPCCIKLTPDRETIQPNADLCFVTVEIADCGGKPVTNATNSVLFTVEGAGKLLAVGSANPKTEEKYSGNTHSAYDGKLMAVVKSTGNGEIILHAFSDGLKTAKLTINAL